MLRTLKPLERFTLVSADGATGNIADFLFDDERWAVRYLITRTGGVLAGRQVLVSPISFRKVDWASGRFCLTLTKEEIENSPDIDTDKPVSRQQEQRYLDYYAYPYYWAYPGAWGMGAVPSLLAASAARSAANVDDSGDDVHLRSAREVRGYDVEGTDAGLGHVDDFIVDDETWELRYLVLDTGLWWFGRKTLMSPRWASEISWARRKVQMDISRHAVRAAPGWDGSLPIERAHEIRLHDHYHRRGYWDEDAGGATGRSQPLRGTG